MDKIVSIEKQSKNDDNNKKRRMCKFNDSLQKQYPFIKKTKTDSDVCCTKCRSDFSVACGGRRDIEKHLGTDKHKGALSVAASSAPLTDFFRSAHLRGEEKQLAAAEGTFAFHTVCHNQSFKSMDCTSRLVQKTFQPKFSCARTKCESIIVNVFSPWAMGKLKDDLNAANFLSVAMDASNHKEVKLFPVVVRYFQPLSGVKVKLLELQNLTGETADIQFNYLRETLQKHDITTKLVAFSADNANTNFGGVARRGTNNVFIKLNDFLQRKVIGVGCAAHMVHNAIQTAADCLPVDVVSVVNKIYMYFYIYTVRVESLKEFCQFAGVEYQRLLQCSNTRWLAMLGAVGKILSIFPGLKSYFLSVDKCPTLLKQFFENPTSEMWLYFLHNQAAMFQETIKKIESQTATFVEVAEELKSLVVKCQERLEQKFVPLVIRNKLRDLEEAGEVDATRRSEKAIVDFYDTCVTYLQRWSVHFEDFELFSWITVKVAPSWDTVEESVTYVNRIFPGKIVDSDLFDELTYVKRFVSSAKLEEWKLQNVSVDQKWVQIFQHFKANDVPSVNLQLLIEFSFSLPGTNAPVERTFSQINNVWTPDKSQLKVTTLRDIMIVQCNIDVQCCQFYDMLLENENLLKAIHGSAKYRYSQ